ncbi:MAG: hypothetical protein HC828_12415 [Blastochloris sp.]|nr:hypothetical protein [Blastochloris sp.]
MASCGCTSDGRVVPVREALQMADDVGLDLVEVAPQAEPPARAIGPSDDESVLQDRLDDESVLDAVDDAARQVYGNFLRRLSDDDVARLAAAIWQSSRNWAEMDRDEMQEEVLHILVEGAVYESNTIEANRRAKLAHLLDLVEVVA